MYKMSWNISISLVVVCRSRLIYRSTEFWIQKYSDLNLSRQHDHPSLQKLISHTKIVGSGSWLVVCDALSRVSHHFLLTDWQLPFCLLLRKTSNHLTAQLVHTHLGVLDLFWSVWLHSHPQQDTTKHTDFFLRRPRSSPPFSLSHIHTYSGADCNAAGTVLQPASVLLCPGLSQAVVYPTSRNKKR